MGSLVTVSHGRARWVGLAILRKSHKFVLEGDEINDVRADGSLPAGTLNLPLPQPSPIAGRGSRVVEDVLTQSSRTTERGNSR